MTTATQTLKISIGNYGHGAALKDGSIRPDGVEFEFIELNPITTAFRRMCRQKDLDISEMAITTYLTAKRYDLPFTAIPIFPVRQFHHGTTMVNTKAGISSPKDLEGKRMGLRAYTVTGTVWARSVLATEHDVDLSKITWVAADEEHVEEFHKDAPPNVKYELGADLAKMLQEGAIAGGIGVGGRTESEDIKSVIPNARQAQAAFYKSTGVYPINHTVVVKNEVLQRDPTLGKRLFEAFKAAKEAWMAKATPEEIASAGSNIVEGDPLPYGVDNNRKAIEAIIGHATDQKILPRRFAIEEVFAAGTLDLG
jgi:4,5-dihydroxyphthalate decarboxylase